MEKTPAYPRSGRPRSAHHTNWGPVFSAVSVFANPRTGRRTRYHLLSDFQVWVRRMLWRALSPIAVEHSTRMAEH